MAKTSFSSIQLNPDAKNKNDAFALQIIDTAGNVLATIGLDGLAQVGILKKITATVNTTETEVLHGLGRIPNIVIPVAVNATAVSVNLTKAPDATKVYVIASGTAAVSAYIYVA